MLKEFPTLAIFLFPRPYPSRCLMMASGGVAFRVLSGLNGVRKTTEKACKRIFNENYFVTQITRKSLEQARNLLNKRG